MDWEGKRQVRHISTQISHIYTHGEMSGIQVLIRLIWLIYISTGNQGVTWKIKPKDQVKKTQWKRTRSFHIKKLGGKMTYSHTLKGGVSKE